MNARMLASKKLRGWGRYTVNLIHELGQLDIKLFLISDRPVCHDHLAGIDSKKVEIVEKARSPYILWEQVDLPEIGRDLSLDIFHCPHHFGLPIAGHFKKVMTLHDAIDESFTKLNMSNSARISLNALKSHTLKWISRSQADAIITVSEFSKSEIKKYYGIPGERIFVTSCAADSGMVHSPVIEFETLSKKYGLKQPYFFYVGGFEQRKNTSFLLETFKKLSSQRDVQLVVGGVGGGRLAQNYKPLNSSILFLDYIPESDLASLYSHAHCFIYPSLYEGFGLQAVESMALGTPAIVSNRTSLPEVIDRKDLTFDPENQNELMALINRSLDDSNFYESACVYAKKRAGDFSWSRTAKKTFEIYQNLLEES